MNTRPGPRERTDERGVFSQPPEARPPMVHTGSVPAGGEEAEGHPWFLYLSLLLGIVVLGMSLFGLVGGDSNGALQTLAGSGYLILVSAGLIAQKADRPVLGSVLAAIGWTSAAVWLWL